MAATIQLTAHEVENSVNIQENTSRLYVCLQITTTAGTYNQSGDTTGVITINGESFSLNGKDVNYNTTTVLYEDTHTIAHTIDGSKSVNVVAVFDPNTPATSQMSASQTVQLTHIPRASTIAATDGDVGSVSMVAVNCRSEQYCHSIFWEFGALSGWLGADGNVCAEQERFTNTSVGFLLPESFYDQIPDSPSGVCTLTCTTYHGELTVGEPQKAAFTVTANPHICSPAVEFSFSDCNPVTVALTGNPRVMVRYASTALCRLTVAGQKGATIVQKTIEGQPIEGDTLQIPAFAQDSLNCSATDSRGYQTGAFYGIRPLEYIPLTANITADRTDPTSGKAQVRVAGQYFNGSFGAKSNTLTLVCQIGGQEYSMTPTFTQDGYEAQLELEGLDYLQSHTLTVIAADEIVTLSRTAVVGKGIPVFDWGETDFRFNVPVKVPDPTENSHAVNKGWAVCRAGDAMTGYLDTAGLGVKWGLELKNGSGQVAGTVEAREQLGTYLTNRAPGNPELYEAFLTPAMTAGRTQSEAYHLLTTKNPVAVAHGGTGASDAAAARANLGLGCASLLPQSLSVEGEEAFLACHGSYKAYLVMGCPRNGNSIVSCLIPAGAVTGELVRYQLADNTDYTAFYLWCGGNVLGIRRGGGNGAITALFGIN